MPSRKSPPSTTNALQAVAFASQAKWKAWLARHHSSSPGVWLEIAKKGSGIASVSYAEAIETALSYGWIDGQKAALDDDRWRQRFTPRTPRSRWSQINRDTVTALIERGEMPLRGSVPDPRRQAARDPAGAHREVRRDARRAPHASPLSGR